MKITSGHRFTLAICGALAGLVFCCVCCASDSLQGPIEPIGKTALESGWKAATITGGLMRPWAAAWLPDGKTLLVTEREGRLRVVRDGKLRTDVVKGVPEVLPLGQGGLLDIVLHPDFTKNRRIYITYSAGRRQANRTVLARGRINNDLTELTGVKTLFQVSQAKQGGQHFGSRLLWLDDGTLLMSIGDGGNPPLQLDGRLIRLNAQDRPPSSERPFVWMRTASHPETIPSLMTIIPEPIPTSGRTVTATFRGWPCISNLGRFGPPNMGLKAGTN